LGGQASRQPPRPHGDRRADAHRVLPARRSNRGGHLILWWAIALATPEAVVEDLQIGQERIEIIRELAFGDPVTFTSQTVDELREQVRREIAEELTSEMAHGMELSLRAFGLVDHSF